jgi:hypothetical protein
MASNVTVATSNASFAAGTGIGYAIDHLGGPNEMPIGTPRVLIKVTAAILRDGGLKQ